MADWLTGWDYRYKVTVLERSGSDLTNYQVKIELSWKWFNTSLFKSNGDDLRVTDDDGTTLLSYWIESWDSDSIVIWVKIPSLAASSTKTIYLYGGNSSASSMSSGDDVFEFFDDFDGSALDTSKWSVLQGNISVSGSNLELTGTTGTRGYIASISKFSYPLILETYAYTSVDNTQSMHFCTMLDGSGWTDGFTIDSDGNPDEVYFYTFNSSSYTITSSISVSSIDSYHNYMAIWDGTKVSPYQDSDLICNAHTTNIPTIDLPVAFREGTVSGEICYVDWVFVRKYTSDEPYITVVDFETNYSDPSDDRLYGFDIDIAMSVNGEYEWRDARSRRFRKVDSDSDFKIRAKSLTTLAIDDSSTLLKIGEYDTSTKTTTWHTVYDGASASGGVYTTSYGVCTRSTDGDWTVWTFVKASSWSNNTIYDFDITIKSDEYQIDSCDSLNDWHSDYDTFSVDTTEKQEGTASLKVDGNGKHLTFIKHFGMQDIKTSYIDGKISFNLWVDDYTETDSCSVICGYSSMYPGVGYGVLTETSITANSWNTITVDMPHGRNGKLDIINSEWYDPSHLGLLGIIVNIHNINSRILRIDNIVTYDEEVINGYFICGGTDYHPESVGQLLSYLSGASPGDAMFLDASGSWAFTYTGVGGEYINIPEGVSMFGVSNNTSTDELCLYGDVSRPQIAMSIEWETLTGSGTFTSGSKDVSGTGTLFTSELSQYDVVIVDGHPDVEMVVRTITDDTHFTAYFSASDSVSGTLMKKQDSPYFKLIGHNDIAGVQFDISSQNRYAIKSIGDRSLIRRILWSGTPSTTSALELETKTIYVPIAKDSYIEDSDSVDWEALYKVPPSWYPFGDSINHGSSQILNLSKAQVYQGGAWKYSQELIVMQEDIDEFKNMILNVTEDLYYAFLHFYTISYPGMGTPTGEYCPTITKHVLFSDWSETGINWSNCPSTTQAITGTIIITDGSSSVTGSGTKFDTELCPGVDIRVNSQDWVTVSSVTDATNLTLTSNAGPSQAGSGSGTMKIDIVGGVSLEDSWSPYSSIPSQSGAGWVRKLLYCSPPKCSLLDRQQLRCVWDDDYDWSYYGHKNSDIGSISSTQSDLYRSTFYSKESSSYAPYLEVKIDTRRRHGSENSCLAVYNSGDYCYIEHNTFYAAGKSDFLINTGSNCLIRDTVISQTNSTTPIECNSGDIDLWKCDIYKNGVEMTSGSRVRISYSVFTSPDLNSDYVPNLTSPCYNACHSSEDDGYQSD